MAKFPMRSLIFVPGHNEKLMLSASRSEADVLLLDIEDSVQPPKNKAVARALIKKMVEEGIFSGRVIFPRVNDRESGQLLKDIYELTIPNMKKALILEHIKLYHLSRPQRQQSMRAIFVLRLEGLWV